MINNTSFILNPVLERACLGEVSDPLDGLVVALLDDLQVADLQARRGVHRHAEVHRDGRTRPRLLLRRVRADALHLGGEVELRASREAADLPQDGVVLRDVLGTPGGDDDLARRGVARDGDDDLDVVGELLRAEAGADGDAEVVARVVRAELLDVVEHLERQADALRRAVLHELELALGRDERDDAVGVELRQRDALVEAEVLDGDAVRPVCGRASAARVGGKHQRLVVHPDRALGHPAQLHLQDDLSGDVGAHDRPLRRHDEVDRLDDVDEDLVLAVCGARVAPRDRAGRLRRDLAEPLLRLVDRLRLAQLDERGEHLFGAVLRIAVVEDLVEDLVNQHEVAVDARLVDGREVRLEDVDDRVKELFDRNG